MTRYICRRCAHPCRLSGTGYTPTRCPGAPGTPRWEPDPDAPRYLLVHSGIFGNCQFTWFDDLDEARRKHAAYKELGMVMSMSGVYQKVEED